MALIEYIKELFGGKNFTRYSLAVAWSGFSMCVIWFLNTQELTGSMKEFGDKTFTFLQAVTTFYMGFYFGTSQSSSDKDDVIKNATKP